MAPNIRGQRAVLSSPPVPALAGAGDLLRLLALLNKLIDGLAGAGRPAAQRRIAWRTPLRVEWLDGRSWMLLTDLIHVDARERVWSIPAGFVTDFASIPRLFRGLVARDAELARAATLHDWLLRNRVLPDREADRLFYQAARLDVGRPVRAAIAYLGVRLGSLARACGCDWAAPRPLDVRNTEEILG